MTKKEICALGNETLLQVFARSRTRLASEHLSMPYTLESRDKRRRHIERDTRIGNNAHEELLRRLDERNELPKQVDELTKKQKEGSDE